MKFKERLWQLFLAIVLGVTLSVCDAGLQDDEFDSNALVAGSAIAAGVTSGDGYVKIGDFMILSGEKTNSVHFDKSEDIIIQQSFQDNDVFIFGSCQDPNNNSNQYNIQRTMKLKNNLGIPGEFGASCGEIPKVIKYTIIGKFQ